MGTSQSQLRTKERPSNLPTGMKQLNNVVHADFTTNRVSKEGQVLISELKKNIKNIIDRMATADLLEEVRSKANLMLEVELSRKERVERMDSLVTEKELEKYHKYKATFIGTVVLMRIGNLMFAFGEDARQLEYLGRPSQLTDSKQTPYFCFHHSDSDRIHKIRTSMNATIIM